MPHSAHGRSIAIAPTARPIPARSIRGSRESLESLGNPHHPHHLRHASYLTWLTAASLAVATLWTNLTVTAGASDRPNIIVVLTDDQGYGDLSAHGNPILKTPNLDRLERESRHFRNFFVSPTCAPTRSALMTGRHEFFNGVTHTILERERMALQAVTLAETLQSSGYATGIFGKWHLGDEPDYQPERRGFDECWIHGGGGIGQTFPGSCGDAPNNRYMDPTLLHNGRFEKTEGYCTDVFFERAISWMDQRRTTSQPFFCWIATNAPHDPYIAKADDAALYDGLGLDEKLKHFYGMIHNIDHNLGVLLDEVDRWGLTQQTLVLFMNDNGSAIGAKTFNAGMRGGKGTAWLGGTRANSFWRWPGAIEPGPCDALTAHIDVFPTLVHVAKAPLSTAAQSQIAGRNLTELLFHPESPWADRWLFTHLGRWPKGTDPSEFKYAQAAIRNTRFTLVSVNGKSQPRWELFDVINDPAQSRDVLMDHPDVAREMAQEYEQWWDRLGPYLVNEQAVGPEENPFKTLYRQQFGESK
jgi:arylsulfatase A-like enzyme